MAKIIFIDTSELVYEDLNTKPVAGAETAYLEFTKALSDLGHDVYMLRPLADNKIQITELGSKKVYLQDRNITGDILVVNRFPKLFYSKNITVKAKCLLLHNKATYLLKWKNLKLMFRHKPMMIFSGKYHKSTYPFWAPSGKKYIIPYGLGQRFLNTEIAATIPKLKVIFTSNPIRELKWLVDIWVNYINPTFPNAELHVFSGSKTYGSWGATQSISSRMDEILKYADDYNHKGIIIREPICKDDLVQELKSSRLMMYKGVVDETFCLAVAEAQALGVPCVVQNIGSLEERVVNNSTGFVTRTDEEFVEKSIQILKDDLLWSKLHKNAIHNSKKMNWESSASQFIKLLD